MMDQKLFDFIRSEPNEIRHVIIDIFNNVQHRFYKTLIEELKSLGDVELDQIKKDCGHILNKNNPLGIDIEAGLWYFSYFLPSLVAEQRLTELCNYKDKKRPKPYDHISLSDLSLDKNYLVDLDAFEIDGSKLSRNGYSFTICPVTPSKHSSYWLSQALSKNSLRNKVKIRLDPFICRKSSEYHSMIYRMKVYGKPLNWNEKSQLTRSDQGQFMPEILSDDGIQITDYIWQPYENELHFTCEELPKINIVQNRGSRYLHSIYDKKSKEIVHLDGAFRIYSITELKKRLLSHVSKPEARKVGKRVKIFQADKPINIEEFSELASSFYVWNEDIVAYFN